MSVFSAFTNRFTRFKSLWRRFNLSWTLRRHLRVVLPVFLTSPSNFDFTDLAVLVKLLLLAVELAGLVESALFGLVSLEEIDAAAAN